MVVTDIKPYGEAGADQQKKQQRLGAPSVRKVPQGFCRAARPELVHTLLGCNWDCGCHNPMLAIPVDIILPFAVSPECHDRHYISRRIAWSTDSRHRFRHTFLLCADTTRYRL